MAEWADQDPEETREWIESLEAVIEREGTERAHFLLEGLIDKARRSGAYLPYSANTAYLNTIPVSKEQRSPGDPAIEWRIRSIIRWNAMAMVIQANREHAGLGGHIASFASSATLYDVGFNHFFHAPSESHGGDLVFIQGHSAPGIYARAFIEGRIEEDDLRRFRQEALGPGLSSYPHPWLMPDFWQFPTVSMGLTPIMAIYQARFMRYLGDRGLLATEGRKVWAFVGDGETDEPESLGAISLAARERLDNLIFVVNCNLQRLDGPVRGNGKIIQELEAVFRGAGWNVIKVIWGSYWDPLIARDTSGLLQKRMEECVDGEYQNYAARDGAYIREQFFGKYPELKAMVASMTDEDLWRLNRGGHDPHKVYAAYHDAVRHTGQPTVILAKTIKGYGMGEAGEGQNFTHQQKKMGEEALRRFRDRFHIPVSDDDLAATPFYRPPEDSPERRYLKERCAALGGFLPARRRLGPAASSSRYQYLRRALEGQRRARAVHHHGLRAHADRAHQRQDRGPALRAHRLGRGPDLRHGGPVPAGRDLFLGGPALPARGPRSAPLLPGGQARSGPPRGDHRGRCARLLDRRGDLVHQPRCAHDPVLHLLFDVRLPAHRGPHLGGR